MVQALLTCSTEESCLAPTRTFVGTAVHFVTRLWRAPWPESLVNQVQRYVPRHGQTPAPLQCQILDDCTASQTASVQLSGNNTTQQIKSQPATNTQHMRAIALAMTTRCVDEVSTSYNDTDKYEHAHMSHVRVHIPQLGSI